MIQEAENLKEQLSLAARYIRLANKSSLHADAVDEAFQTITALQERLAEAEKVIALGLGLFDPRKNIWNTDRNHWCVKAREYAAAQAIEARSGETGTGSTEGESAVGNADAPNEAQPLPDTSQDNTHG